VRVCVCVCVCASTCALYVDVYIDVNMFAHARVNDRVSERITAAGRRFVCNPLPTFSPLVARKSRTKLTNDLLLLRLMLAAPSAVGRRPEP
jgi:hypothetical protein